MSVAFTVEIDWDHDDTWTDETARIRRVQIKSGFEQPGAAVAAIGRCTLTLDNYDRRFTPGEPSSPLVGKLLPRRAVRVQASDGVSIWTLFRGLIDAIQPDAGAWGGGECRITASDGLALLATQRVGVAHEDTKSVHDAISAVVGAAYTPPAADYADNGDTLTHYGRAWTPEQTTCRDALHEICDAVYGRFFIARDGTAVYQTRAYRQNSSISPAIFVGEVAYWQRVKEIRRANLLAYWRLNESAGATAYDSGDFNRDAAVSGITWGAAGIGDGSSAVQFDGAQGWINLYSASLHGMFYAEKGTLLVWIRAGSDAVWSDGAVRYGARLYVDSSNLIEILKDGENWIWRYKAAGTLEQISVAANGAAWHCLALTWDRAADQVIAYLDGVVQGDPQTGVGRWSGVLDVTRMVLGAASTAGGSHWDGDLAHAALWNAALTPAEIAMLAGV